MQILHRLPTFRNMTQITRTLSTSSTTRNLSSASPTFQTTTKHTTNTTLPTWPQPIYDSHGDYLTDATTLEPHIPGPLYQNQLSLPRLPIPSLTSTIDKFLPTALPLCTTKDETTTLLSACNTFPAQAQLLQDRLQQRANDSVYKDSSWLQHWWNTLGYLQFRDSVVINVSYFFHFEDDTTLSSEYDDRDVKRAATLLVGAASFRNQVVSGQMPPDVLGKKKTPLCSAAYKYMFHACRIPQKDEDVCRLYDPSLQKHCLVACQGKFFAFDFLDEDGEVLSMDVLEGRLKRCREMANKGKGVEIGWFTGWDRDQWADAREEMVRVGGEKVEKALGVLESAVLCICLDDEAPTSRNQVANNLLHGNVTSSHNRWFDKSIQLVCTKNGKAGLIGEHCMMDGMPVVNFSNHVTKLTYHDAKNMSHGGGGDVKEGDVIDIFGDCYDELTGGRLPQLLEDAKQDLTDLITAHSITSLAFHGYGANFIKHSSYSPDAFVQSAMQLATYRLFHAQAGTYEATQVRPFLHGRTETTRSVSPSTAAFVHSMGLYPRGDELDSNKRKEKLSLLKKATEDHVAFMNAAANAHGVDRHFFGLSMLVQENETPPDLFQHPVYQKSKTWRVSTSHLTHPKFSNWGYGEVVPDGVGMSYMIKPFSCHFNITARKEWDYTDRLSYLVEESLLEMKGLIEVEKGLASKL